MNQQPMFPSLHRQRGAVLIVSLLLLLVITVLALGASQSTRLEERIAGSQRNYDLAFQSAEAALRAGERWVKDSSRKRPPVPCNQLGNPPCQVYERNLVRNQVPYAEQAYQNDAWWAARTQPYATDGNQISGAGRAVRDPMFYIEFVEEVPDHLTTTPTGPAPARLYYRIVSRGLGGTADATVVLHSTFVRRYQ
jgi:type IV pilus assembly protein PilX